MKLRWQQDGWRILVLSGGTARGERMRQSFEDEGVKAAFDELGSAAPQNGESLIRTSTHLLGMKLGYHRAEHMSRLAARLPGRYNK